MLAENYLKGNKVQYFKKLIFDVVLLNRWILITNSISAYEQIDEGMGLFLSNIYF